MTLTYDSRNDNYRRCRIDLASPGETAIRAAMQAVESMGADLRLTDAMVHLGRALDSVADFVDGVPRRNVDFVYPKAAHP